ARSVGINWAFAPVSDLDLAPRDPCWPRGVGWAPNARVRPVARRVACSRPPTAATATGIPTDRAPAPLITAQRWRAACSSQRPRLEPGDHAAGAGRLQIIDVAERRGGR